MSRARDAASRPNDRPLAPPLRGRGGRRWAVAALILTALALAPFPPGRAQPSEAAAADSLALVPGADEPVRQGAVLYAYHCAVCHGDTGEGLAEARESFPPSHRSCTRCHRPANPAVMPPESVGPDDAFSIGSAPALLGDGAAERFGSSEALFGFVRATMPRHAPGSLNDATYARIVDFLSDANQRSRATPASGDGTGTGP